MAVGKPETKKSRGGRRELRRRFEALIDVSRFDYEKRTEVGRAQARLYGVAAAGVLYGLGFVGGYFAWSNQTLPVNQFSMLTWMWMVPCTFIGILVWKVVSTRREYPVRQEIRRYIGGLESNGGLLWRFAPLFDRDEIDGSTTGRVIELSREGRGIDIALEDYARAVGRVQALLSAAENIVKADSLQDVQRNLSDAA